MYGGQSQGSVVGTHGPTTEDKQKCVMYNLIIGIYSVMMYAQ